MRGRSKGPDTSTTAQHTRMTHATHQWLGQTRRDHASHAGHTTSRASRTSAYLSFGTITMHVCCVLLSNSNNIGTLPHAGSTHANRTLSFILYVV